MLTIKVTACAVIATPVLFALAPQVEAPLAVFEAPTTAVAEPVLVSQTPGIQSRDLYGFRSVSDAQISADGRRIAYVVQDREGEGRPRSRIFLMDVGSGETRRLGGADATGSSPRWSPDGRWIAYIGREGERSGLFIVPGAGGDARFLAAVSGTNHPLPSTGEQLSWAPDSRRIAFLSSMPGSEGRYAESDPIVIRRYLYKSSGGDGHSYFNDNRRLHILTVDIETAAVRQLTDGPYYEHSIDWSPHGDEILFVSNREPEPDRSFNYDIFAIRVEDGRLRRLTSRESVVYRPRWSPDGLQIAYQGTLRGLTSSETTMEDTHVWTMDADGRNAHQLAPGLDNRQGAPGWSPDGTGVYFTVRERGSTTLYQVPVDGGSARRIVPGPGSVRSWSVGPDGVVAYSLHAPTDLPQLYLRSGGGSKQLTNLNREILAEHSIAPVEPLTFVTYDGLEVQAFLTLPHGRTSGSKHAMIVMIHGGPHGMQGPALDLKAQAYASEGWAALQVNYRGSTGYGQAFADAIFGDQNGREAQDVLQGVDAVVRRYKWIDRNRLGIEGGSYGGQLTNWIITQTDRFKAAIPRAGIANLIVQNYLSYYHDYLAVEYGGFPHEGGRLDRLWERSAIRYIAQVSTPTMLVHGLNDHNVPRAEAEMFFIALRDVGVEAELVLYPREGHGFRETGHVVDFTERSIAWYQKHFGRAEMSTAGPYGEGR